MLSQKYVGCDEKLLLECSCGNKFKVTYSKFKLGQRSCKDCTDKIRIKKLTKTDEKFREEVYELVKDEYTFLEPYKGTSTHILCKHNKCGYTWSVRPSHFIFSGTRCPSCAGCKLKTDEEFKSQVFDLVSDEYIFLEEYVNRAKKLECMHTICGHIWSVSPHNFIINKTRCPLCLITKGEKAIRDYLICNRNIILEFEYSFTDLVGVGGHPLRFDFAVLNKHKEVLFLVEYDGEQHFRCVNFLGKGMEKEALKEFKTLKIHDKYKNDYCQTHNIQLLRIPYTEFDNISTILNEWLIKFDLQE